MGKHKPNSVVVTGQWPIAAMHHVFVQSGLEFSRLTNEFTHPLQLKLIPQTWYEFKFTRLSMVVETTILPHPFFAGDVFKAQGADRSLRSNLRSCVIVRCVKCSRTLKDGNLTSRSICAVHCTHNHLVGLPLLVWRSDIANMCCFQSLCIFQSLLLIWKIYLEWSKSKLDISEMYTVLSQAALIDLPLGRCTLKW